MTGSRQRQWCTEEFRVQYITRVTFQIRKSWNPHCLEVTSSLINKLGRQWKLNSWRSDAFEYLLEAGKSRVAGEEVRTRSLSDGDGAESAPLARIGRFGDGVDVLGSKRPVDHRIGDRGEAQVVIA
jgi:hypothetical protein